MKGVAIDNSVPSDQFIQPDGKWVKVLRKVAVEKILLNSKKNALVLHTFRLSHVRFIYYLEVLR
jgi:hypothetical protein